jgi:hypothetical protein
MISQGSSMIEGELAFSRSSLAGLLIPLIGAPERLFTSTRRRSSSFLLVLTASKRKPLRAQRSAAYRRAAAVRDGLISRSPPPLRAGFGHRALRVARSSRDHFELPVRGSFRGARRRDARRPVCAVFVVGASRLKLAAFGILAFAVPLWVLPLTSRAGS